MANLFSGNHKDSKVGIDVVVNINSNTNIYIINRMVKLKTLLN